jgi:uncharacterized membrane protein YqaE (UPF0057 family)
MIDQFIPAVLHAVLSFGAQNQYNTALSMQMFPLHGTPAGAVDLFAGATVLCILVASVLFFFFLLWLLTLVDLMRSDFLVPTNKITWLILLLFLPPLGVVLYWIIGSKQKIESPDSSGDVDTSYRGRRSD